METAPTSANRRPFIAALLSVPYLAAYTWYIGGAMLSSIGRWPHWPHHELGYYPPAGFAETLSTVVVLSLWCVPLPPAAALAAGYACAYGLRRGGRALAWAIPAGVALLAAVAVTAWAAVAAML